jgi:hypothetical protein
MATEMRAGLAKWLPEIMQHAPVEQPGVLVGFSPRRSRVQIPYGAPPASPGFLKARDNDTRSCPNGQGPAFQAEDEGSIPSDRSSARPDQARHSGGGARTTAMRDC